MRETKSQETFFFDCTVESFNIKLSFALYQFTSIMPSLTGPIISNIKMKNSCRRILTRNALTPPPSAPPSVGQIEAELKVKSYSIYSY
jgi:hypothetical protein